MIDGIPNRPLYVYQKDIIGWRFFFNGDSLFSIKAISDLDPSKAIIDLPVSKAEMMIPTDILRVETTIKPKDQHVSWAKILGENPGSLGVELRKIDLKNQIQF